MTMSQAGSTGTVFFDCTMCGACCQNLRLPLTVDEAVAWLSRGGAVQVMCDAVPWPNEPPADDLPAAHKRRRSAPAHSGTLPIRVTVVLAAVFDGACPNLGGDMRCGIYKERPMVCRIYPAEINPFVALDTQAKNCPPEAWTASTPLLKGGRLVDGAVLALVAQSRAADEREAPLKRHVCETLGITQAAFPTEGTVIHVPAPADLLAALVDAPRQRSLPDPSSHWQFVAKGPALLDMLGSVGARVHEWQPEDMPRYRLASFQ
jgi:Fe-S-cluster containining protein